MAKKRNLKKVINYICSNLFAECVAASLYGVKTNEENVNALLSSILRMHNDYISRISHPEPGILPKNYYKNILESFNKDVSEVIDQISNMN
ncbi:MAG: hypothetical protein IKH99_04980 [Prevotella sp.]|nr:hypothetical protein [Prevotella sp.]